MEYFTTVEFSKLKGCSVQFARRYFKNNINVVIKNDERNNRPQSLLPISALPADLREKYYKQQRKSLGLLPEQADVPQASDTMPLKRHKNTVKKALDEYSEAERERIAFWIGALKEWQAARAKFKNKTEADPLFCAKIRLEHPELTISPDILYRKYRAYRAGDLQVLAESRGGWNKGKSHIDEMVWSIFTSYYLTTNRLTADNCYTKTVAVCKEHYPELVDGIPSSRTFRRHIKDIPEAVIAYGRDGAKAFRDKYLEYVDRNLSRMKCNDVWIADNHTLDFFTLSDDGRVHRPSITTFQDAKSGVIVSAELCDHPNSDTTLLAIRSAVLRGFGLPIGMYFDNGSEFCASDVAGRGHRKKASWQKEEYPVQILALLGISVTNAIPTNARAKPIERFFNTFKEHYSKSVESYCGGKPEERPEECKRLVKEQKLITDEEIRKMLPIFIRGHNSELYGGKEKLYKGKKRIDVWNEAVLSGDVEFRTTDRDNLNLLMRRTTRVQKIKRNGVFIEWAGRKLWYKSEDTVFHIDKDREVYVRFDPSDLREVQVYDNATGKHLYTYPAADYLSIPFIGAEQEDIQKCMQAQAKSRKAVKKQLDDYRKYDGVSLLKAELLRAEQNSEGYSIAKPEAFVPVIAEEHKASSLNITKIAYADLKRLNEVREKTKGA